MAVPCDITCMGIVWFLIVMAVSGLIVGAVARLLLPGPDPMGLLGTILGGIAGSFVGTLIGRLLFGPNYAAGFILAVIGAMIIIGLLRLTRRPRATY